MKHVVIAATLALCAASSSFGKAPSPACAALQDAKEASASGKKFEPYRLLTKDGEQMVATPEQAVQIWAPLCQGQQASGAKIGVSSKAAGQKPG